MHNFVIPLYPIHQCKITTTGPQLNQYYWARTPFSAQQYSDVCDADCAWIFTHLSIQVGLRPVHQPQKSPVSHSQEPMINSEMCMEKINLIFNWTPRRHNKECLICQIRWHSFQCRMHYYVSVTAESLPHCQVCTGWCFRVAHPGQRLHSLRVSGLMFLHLMFMMWHTCLWFVCWLIWC